MRGIVMNFITRSLLTLLAATSLCHGSNWYVATNASGNGSIASPWSLQNAITNSSIKPGDTVWLRNGVYFPTATFPTWNVTILGWMPKLNGTPNNLIRLSSYSNEWAAIDREWTLSASSYIRFQNLEFYDSLKGHNPTNSNYPNGPWAHFPMSGQPGFQWINCVIHDVDNCFSGGVDNEQGYLVRGCIIWYVGWNVYEHVCYPAPDVCSGNISGWHLLNMINLFESNSIVQSNIMFGGGQTEDPPNANCDINGGGGGTWNQAISWNYCYNRFPTATTPAEALSLQGDPPNLVVNNNVLVAAKPCYFAGNDGVNFYTNASFYSNTVYASSPNYPAGVTYWRATSGSWTFDGNSYYTTAANPLYFFSATLSEASFSTWKSSTGFDVHSTASAGTMPPYAVYVIPNQDQAKRANIAVYNWPKSNNVVVSLSGILNGGDSYNLYSAQNFDGGVTQTNTYGTNGTVVYTARGVPIQSGTYNGASITIPMTNLTVAPLLYGTNISYDGVSIVQPSPTSPEFGAFVVIGAAASLPLPPTDLHVISQ